MRPHDHRSDSGFTLLELTVALGLGAVISLTLYTLSAGTARIFHEQQRIAQTQLALRSAVERLRAEIGRAGYLATPDSALDPEVCPPGSLACPSPELHGLILTSPDPDGVSALPLAATNLAAQPDALTVFGAFDDTDSYFTTQLGAGTLQLDTTTASYAQRFGAAAAVGNLAAVLADTFSTDKVLRIKCPGQSAVFQTITGVVEGPPIEVSYDALNGVGPYNPPGIGWRCEVSTASFVRYQIRNVCALFPATCENGTEPTKTDLIRVDLTPDLNEIPGSERIIAEYAVDFDVSFEIDQADVPGTPGSVNPPAIGHCDWAASSTLADGTANSLVGRIRAVLFRLSVRSRAEDPNFPWVANPALPILRFKLDDTSAAACHVRTVTSRVELANFAVANIQSPAVGAPCPQ
jgi:prepilin-type N-terminal cleavage/methylation domain-containing protein